MRFIFLRFPVSLGARASGWKMSMCGRLSANRDWAGGSLKPWHASAWGAGAGVSSGWRWIGTERALDFYRGLGAEVMKQWVLFRVSPKGLKKLGHSRSAG
jgi:hypothetical protein